MMIPHVHSAKEDASSVGAYKLAAACRYLGGLSPITVRRLVERGLLRPNRAVRHLLFSRAELDRFLLEGGE